MLARFVPQRGLDRAAGFLARAQTNDRRHLLPQRSCGVGTTTAS